MRCLAVAVLLSANPLFGDETPWVVPVATMIARAEAIALVRVNRVESIPQPRDGLREPRSWIPDHLLTLSVRETLRGKLPKVVTTDIEADPGRIAAPEVGDEALLFVGTMMGRKGQKERDRSYVYAFEGSQGVMFLRSLADTPEQMARILSAIKEAVRAYRPPEGAKDSGWEPILNDAAAEPFLLLLADQDSTLARWAGYHGLRYVRVTPRIGAALVAVLEHKDGAVQRAAAEHLIVEGYRPATAALRRMTTLDPDLARMVRCFLQAWVIEDHLNTIDGEAAAALAKLVLIRAQTSDGDPSFGIMCRAERDGSVEATVPSGGPCESIAAAVRLWLLKLDKKQWDILPFRADVHTWCAEGRPRFRVVADPASYLPRDQR